MQTFSILYRTPTTIYFSNNYFTIVTIQDYFHGLWQGKKAQALPKLHKYLHNHLLWLFIEMYWSVEIEC